MRIKEEDFPYRYQEKIMHTLLSAILHRLAGDGKGPLLSRREAEEFIHLPASCTTDMLSVAGVVRAARAPSFFNCGIINAKSGRCPENCAFCAQSAHHETGAPVYPFMDEETLLRKAAEAAAHGSMRFGIVVSGTMLGEADVEPLCRAVERIVRETGMSVCGSLGMLTKERAACYREAGVTRYHHNLETAESYFPNICTTHAYAEDVQSLRVAREAGLEVCSGGIIGLGESLEQRVELACTLAELDVNSIPLNFLNAIAGTRLEHMPRLAPEEALRAIALFRVMNPDKDLLIAGGRGHVLGAWQSWLYAAGANGMMIGDYLTTSGAAFEADLSMMRTLGVKS